MIDTPNTDETAPVDVPGIHDMPVETVPIDTIQPMPGNPRIGDRPMLVASLNHHGQYRPIVVHSATGNIIAGNNTWHAAKERGDSEIAVQWLDVDDTHARKINLDDNRTSDKATYDDKLLLDFLEELPDLDGTVYDPADLQSLGHILNSSDYDTDRAAEKDEAAQAPPQKRTLPLDLSLSWGIGHPVSLIAMAMGWGLGCISTSANNARRLYERYPRTPRMKFMDNEWHGYDHQLHLDAVADIQPIYATVRDLVTREQAEHEGVDYYTVQQTLDMAADLAPHVDNIILIPKYDCLDELPETIGDARVVLGYSVESSYGGTPLPIKAMQGRPIHLLGGAWKRQREYLNLMRDDVVSLDNNNLCKIAEWGNVNLGDGSTRPLDEITGIRGHKNFYPAVLLSMSLISAAVMNDYGTELDPTIVTDEPTSAAEEVRA